MKTYEWTPGARFNVSPQVAGEVIESLRDKHGKVEPEMIVKAATMRSSPLHQAFPWDDATAAHKHRLSVASDMSRSYRLVIEEPDGAKRLLRPHFHIKNAPDGPGYYSTDKIQKSPDLRKLALEESYRLLLGILNRYAELKELKGVRKEVELLKTMIG